MNTEQTCRAIVYCRKDETGEKAIFLDIEFPLDHGIGNDKCVIGKQNGKTLWLEIEVYDAVYEYIESLEQQIRELLDPREAII